MTSSAATVSVPAVSIRDPRWLAAQLDATRRLYGPAGLPVLGVLWWYSASSVLLGPPVETLVVTGRAADPDLTELTLFQYQDGRLVRAVSDGVLEHADLAEVGRRMGTALGEAIEAVANTSGARERTLWAIATDSLANRLLWVGTSTGQTEKATAMAAGLAEGIGDRMPRPRYVDVDGRRFVRRASCCLIYRATAGDKCTSCPRLAPDERLARLRGLARPS